MQGAAPRLSTPDCPSYPIKVFNGATEVPHPSIDQFIVKESALADAGRVLVLLPKRDEIYKPGGAEDLFTRLGSLWKEVQSGNLELARFKRKKAVSFNIIITNITQSL